jgi:hypothetical protein
LDVGKMTMAEPCTGAQSASSVNSVLVTRKESDMTAIAHEKAAHASTLIDQATDLVKAALVNPTPAAGPAAAFAIAPLTQAASDLIDCARDLDAHGKADLAGEGRGLSDASGARARELGFAQLAPWPFIYSPLGAIYAALRTLQQQAADYKNRVPIFLDPAHVAQGPSDQSELQRTLPTPTRTWSPDTFPWPGLGKLERRVTGNNHPPTGS